MAVFAIVGGLALAGYGFSWIRNRRNTKPSVQKLFK